MTTQVILSTESQKYDLAEDGKGGLGPQFCGVPICYRGHAVEVHQWKHTTVLCARYATWDTV